VQAIAIYSEMRGPKNVKMTLFNKRLTLREVIYFCGLGTDDLGKV